MDQNRPSRLTSFLADAGLFYAAAIWGATFIVVKDSLAFIHPVTLVGARFTLAALVMAAVLVPLGKKLFTGFRTGFILGFVLWLLYLPQTIGLEYTTAANSAFITGLFVAFLPPLYVIFYKALPTPPRMIAVGISLLGLWFITGGLAEINAGDLLTAGAAFAYALHILVADRYVKGGIDPWVLSFQQFLTVGLLGFAAMPAMGIPFAMISPTAGWYILFLALFPTLSAFVIQLLAQRVTPPVRVSLIFALEPVFGAIFAWTMGGEAFVPLKAFGGLLIVLAIVIAELPFGSGPSRDAGSHGAENCV